MKKLNPAILLLVGGISVISLTGCEQMEQAANEVVEKAKQSAVQVLDEATQPGSIDQARQSASQALLEARQMATGLLGHASDYLSKDPQAEDIARPPAENSPSVL